MKNILCTTLLAAGLAGNVFVYGQVRREGMTFRGPLVQALRTSPAPVVPVPGCLSPGARLFSSRSHIRVVPTRGVINGDSVRIMGPDRMPCMSADLSKVERIPVKKLDSRWVRPMPNGVPDGRPHVQVVPRQREEKLPKK